MKKIRILSFWKNTTKEGEMYLSASFGQGRKVMIFKNKYKNKDTDPDYVAYLCEDEKQESVAEKTNTEATPF